MTYTSWQNNRFVERAWFGRLVWPQGLALPLEVASFCQAEKLKQDAEKAAEEVYPSHAAPPFSRGTAVFTFLHLTARRSRLPVGLLRFWLDDRMAPMNASRQSIIKRLQTPPPRALGA